jgi:hypothetical protein
MLTYMLDTNICIYVMKNYPQTFAGTHFRRMLVWTTNSRRCQTTIGRSEMEVV